MSPDIQHRSEFVEHFALGGAGISFFFAVFYSLVFEFIEGAIAMGLTAAALAGCVAVRRASGSPARAGNFAVAAMVSVVTYIASLRDDLPVTPLAYFTLLPLVASYVAGKRSAAVWTAVVSVIAVGLGVRFAAGLAFRRVSPTDAQIVVADLIGLVALFIIVGHLARIIGERRRREEAERQAMVASLQRAERFESLGRLVGGIAHEINNPLASVVANIETVLGGLAGSGTPSPPAAPARGQHTDGAPGPAAEWLEALEDALRGAARVQRVVSDLRQYGEHQEGPPAPIAMSTLIEWVVSLATPEVRARARLRAECFESVEISAPRSRLAQALINVVLYLADLMPEETRDDNSIELHTRVVDATFAVTVTAHAPSLISSRTTPLLRIAARRGEEALRHGASLSVSSDIVAALGGSLALEPATTTTRRVTIMLPLRPSLTQTA